MKALRLLKISVILLLVTASTTGIANAQDSTAAPTILSVSYFLPVNNVPYLQISTKKKTGRKFIPVNGIPVNIYFKDTLQNNLLGKVITDAEGLARIGFPPSFRSSWDSLNEFKFVATSDLPAGQEPLSADITIKKAILVIDTTSADGVRTVTGELKEKSGNTWVPVKSIDMKLSIKRMDGNLSVGDQDTYTSDSTGVASAEFKSDSIPGDLKGNITLVAKVEDNDTYGNLATQETVGWGKAIQPPKDFFAQRTLWSTRFETPLWLLFSAYFLVISVWSTIFYLIYQLVKIKRLGALKK